MPMTLKEALKVILKDEFLGDWIYAVRDRASENRSEEEQDIDRWKLPRVKRFAEACTVLEKYYETL